MLTSIFNEKIVSARFVTTEHIKGNAMRDFLSRYDGSKMSYVRQSRNGRVEHFRHHVTPEFLTKKYGGGGESADHMMAKSELMRIVERNRGLEDKKNIIVIDEDFKSFDGERIPDISVFYDGSKMPVEIFEIQLSQIPIQDIIDRTKFYLDNGVEIVSWFFDTAADWHRSSDIKGFLWNYNARYGLITYTKDIISDDRI